ncbi:MAG: hypothetical protein SGPRY_007223 [Prymnesium sp.]
MPPGSKASGPRPALAKGCTPPPLTTPSPLLTPLTIRGSPPAHHRSEWAVLTQRDVSSLADAPGHGRLPSPSRTKSLPASKIDIKALELCQSLTPATALSPDASSRRASAPLHWRVQKEEPSLKRSASCARLASPASPNCRASPSLTLQSNPPSPTPKANSSPPRKGVEAGPRIPANRTDAEILWVQLDAELRALEGKDFRAELRVYDEVFKEVVKQRVLGCASYAAWLAQVSVHCTERGALLDRLRAFFTRSMNITAHQAQQSIAKEMKREVTRRDLKIDGLEAECRRLERCVAELQKELLRTQSQLAVCGARKDVFELFEQLPPEEKASSFCQIFKEMEGSAFFPSTLSDLKREQRLEGEELGEEGCELKAKMDELLCAVRDLHKHVDHAQPLLDAMHAVLTSPDEVIPAKDLSRAANLLLSRLATEPDSEELCSVLCGPIAKLSDRSQEQMLRTLLAVMGSNVPRAVEQAVCEEERQAMLRALFDSTLDGKKASALAEMLTTMTSKRAACVVVEALSALPEGIRLGEVLGAMAGGQEEDQVKLLGEVLGDLGSEQAARIIKCSHQKLVADGDELAHMALLRAALECASGKGLRAEGQVEAWNVFFTRIPAQVVFCSSAR